MLFTGRVILLTCKENIKESTIFFFKTCRVSTCSSILFVLPLSFFSWHCLPRAVQVYQAHWRHSNRSINLAKQCVWSIRVIPSGKTRKYTDTRTRANRQSVLFICLSSVFLPAGRLWGGALVVGCVVRVVLSAVFFYTTVCRPLRFSQSCSLNLPISSCSVLPLSDYSAVNHNLIGQCPRVRMDTHTHTDRQIITLCLSTYNWSHAGICWERDNQL